MLELREELAALIEWEEADFECVTQTEIDAVAHRILRRAELPRPDARDFSGELELEDHCIGSPPPRYPNRRRS
jgi:hypothetical protein